MSDKNDFKQKQHSIFTFQQIIPQTTVTINITIRKKMIIHSGFPHPSPLCEGGGNWIFKLNKIWGELKFFKINGAGGEKGGWWVRKEGQKGNF